MEITTLVLASYETNCYVLRPSTDSADCLVIDTGLEAEELVDFLKSGNLKPAALILTHGHVDHIMGAGPLRALWPDMQLIIHRHDLKMLTCPQKNLAALAGIDFASHTADVIIDAEGPVEFAKITFEVIHTPGHTPGGISLYCKSEKCVFTGDALFAGSVGRSDLPGGDPEQLIGSIKSKLLVLPDETVVYPGHGPGTTIGREKALNPFLV